MTHQRDEALAVKGYADALRDRLLGRAREVRALHDRDEFTVDTANVRLNELELTLRAIDELMPTRSGS
jgi:hypothetical protein